MKTGISGGRLPAALLLAGSLLSIAPTARADTPCCLFRGVELFGGAIVDPAPDPMASHGSGMFRSWEALFGAGGERVSPLGLELEEEVPSPAVGGPTGREVSLPQPRSKWSGRRTRTVTAGLIAVIPVAGYFAWWRSEEPEGFHIAHEGWFGRETYSGGADKVSHFYANWILGRELTRLYARGHSPESARALGLGLMVLTGLLVEAGDGLTNFGFSWEDVAAGILGGLAGSEVARRGWDDVLGMRMGPVPARVPPRDGRAHGISLDYSRHVYSADVRLAGALRRLSVEPGVARFLLLSVTYGTKGYRFSPVDRRERNLGLDLGLNLPEVASALGVTDSTWWGRALRTFLSYYRIPYTAFGYRYDLNHGRWNGPDTGEHFDPGKVIYP